MNRSLGIVLISVLAAMTALPLLATVSSAADDACGATVTSLNGAAYIAYDGAVTDGSVWIYIESNNQPGLQRGGVGVSQPIWDVTGVISDAETCNASATPDTLIF
ncbi:MAG: hypothetical protein ACYDCK_15085 [Thermoplasmatota archaeon]